MAGILKDYGHPLNWNVGSLFCHEETLFKMMHLCRAYGEELPVKWAFGSVASLLAGGRSPRAFLDADEAIEILNWHLQNGVACRLTLSNPYADREMIERDSINAALMNHLNENSIASAKNGIIVTTDALARYARDRYPNLEVVLSIIRPAFDTGYGKDRDTLEWYSEKLQNPLYDAVVVNNAKVREQGFLESLPSRNKVELIACHECVANCPYAKRHYSLTSKLSVGLFLQESIETVSREMNELMRLCISNKAGHLDGTASLGESEIRRLASAGIRQFKLAGRMNAEERFERDFAAYLFNYEVYRYAETAVLGMNAFKPETP